MGRDHSLVLFAGRDSLGLGSLGSTQVSSFTTAPSVGSDMRMLPTFTSTREATLLKSHTNVLSVEKSLGLYQFFCKH